MVFLSLNSDYDSHFTTPEAAFAMTIIVKPTEIPHIGTLTFKGKTYTCALGREGIGPKEKEGDFFTPLGIWPLRFGFYRPDRMEKPESQIPFLPLSLELGWCDDPKDPFYNRLIKRPYDASHEELWREDNVYDLILVLGYNDNPVIFGKGSAIFMHIARENPETLPPHYKNPAPYSHTAGCIALSRKDFLAIIKGLDCHTMVDIQSS